MRLLPLFLSVFGFVGVPAVLAQGCCGTAPAPARQASSGCAHAAMGSGCAHEDHKAGQHPGPSQAVDPKAAAAAKAALPRPVQTVFKEYINVQNGLAADSMERVKVSADALAQAVRNDQDDVLPPQVSQQAHALAEAPDLKTVRDAFKLLSESLINYGKAARIVPAPYVEVYCSMAKAGWLQIDKTIKNPYYGSSMLGCGKVRS